MAASPSSPGPARTWSVDGDELDQFTEKSQRTHLRVGRGAGALGVPQAAPAPSTGCSGTARPGSPTPPTTGARQGAALPRRHRQPRRESLTRADLTQPFAYVSTERNDDAGQNQVSRLSVLRYDLGAAGAQLTATHEWNLTADLPPVGPNLGLEAITWIPDAFLVAEGFIDQSTSAAL
jgi:hypothetical protein